MARLTQDVRTARGAQWWPAPQPAKPAPRPEDARPTAAAAARPARTATRTAVPRAHRVPVRRLTVLYDPACRLCAFVRDWLVRQRQLVRLEMVPVGSPEARRRFPELDHAATEREITVVGDAGQLYRGDSAWLVCLWALADHRPLAHTLASPTGRKLARAAVLTASKYREKSAARWGPTAARPGDRLPYRAPSGWVYDKTGGWRQSAAAGDDAGCADGCPPTR